VFNNPLLFFLKNEEKWDILETFSKGDESKVGEIQHVTNGGLSNTTRSILPPNKTRNI